MGSNKRWDAKRDANEAEIVRALESAYCSVMKIDDLDLLVGFNGINFILEVKTHDGRVSKGQAELIRSWRGRKPTVVRSVQEAFQAVGLLPSDGGTDAE